VIHILLSCNGPRYTADNSCGRPTARFFYKSHSTVFYKSHSTVLEVTQNLSVNGGSEMLFQMLEMTSLLFVLAVILQSKFV
jgi:predicted ArsR family transcriptional regulator